MLLCVVLFSFNDSVINYLFLSVFIPFRLGYLIAWPETQMELVFSSRLTNSWRYFFRALNRALRTLLVRAEILLP